MDRDAPIPFGKRIARVLRVVGLLLLVQACGSPTSALPSPTPAATPHIGGVAPPARDFPIMVYDAAHRYVLLFGGGSMEDTWIWEGSGWTELHPAHHPVATTETIGAFDPVGRHVLLIESPTPGVNGGTTTWTWDGSDWYRQQTVHQPDLGFYASLTPDPRTGRLLLIAVNKPSWEWDGGDWIPDATPAPPSGGTVMYDEALSTIVALGVAGGEGSPAAWKLMRDTSASVARSAVATYAWARYPSSGGAGPDYPIGQAVYHGALGKVVYFKDTGVSGASGWETWTWDAGTWLLWPQGNQPRGFWRSSETYDAALNALVFFGGGDVEHGIVTPRNETWLLTTSGWSRTG